MEVAGDQAGDQAGALAGDLEGQTGGQVGALGIPPDLTQVAGEAVGQVEVVSHQLQQEVDLAEGRQVNIFYLPSHSSEKSCIVMLIQSCRMDIANSFK